MGKSTSDRSIWLFVILYLAFLVGLFFLMKLITPLPYILLICTTFLSYLIYKGKLPGIARKDGSSVIALLFVIIVVATSAFMSKPYIYKNYVGKYIVPGEMVTRTVTVEADEGPNTWEEKRNYWEPKTKTGETIMEIIGWFEFWIDSWCIYSVSKIPFKI